MNNMLLSDDFVIRACVCVGLYQISDLLSGFEFEWLRLTAVKCSRVENQMILASQKCSGAKVNLKCIQIYLLIWNLKQCYL